MSPNAPLTDQQRNAVIEARARYTSALLQRPPSTAESVDERARCPDPGSIPADVTVRVEIAPPSPHPHPLFDNALLKKPERVPLYFYSLLPEPEPESEAVRANTRVVFFIHGGGNLVGHPTHAPLVQFCTQLLRGIASHAGEPGKALARCVLVAPSYRLATVPEQVFPAALQDLVAAYDYVLSKGYDASNVIIAGDSAGGNHAVVLTHLVLQSGGPSPRGVVAIAPSSLNTFEVTNAPVGAEADILDQSTYENAARKYVGDTGASLTDPLVSGALIPFTASWPRTLILVGTADHLLHASRELEKRLSAVHRPVELVQYDGRPHGWWVMPQVFPENVEDGVERIANFVLQ